MSKRKVLILGVTSNIGYRFYQSNQELFDIYGLCRNWPLAHVKNIYEVKTIDINVVKQIVDKLQPDVIINCISIGNVDRCQMDSHIAEEINFNFAKKVLDLSKAQRIKSINFSSSLIYDGLAESYDENSVAAPLNEYGQIKLKFDLYARQYLDQSLLIRPTSIFGFREHFQRDNPLSFIIDKLLQNQNLLLVTDVTTNLLYVDDLIDILTTMLINDICGEFNIGGSEAFSRYEMGNRIKQCISSSTSKITEASSSEFKSIALRPPKVIVTNQKLHETIPVSFTSLEDSVLQIISLRENNEV